jgi:nicotinamide-nucleotide amidase
VTDVAASILAELARRHLTLAVAESLTGGLLTAEFVRVPGASRVLVGGVVAYNTGLKHSVLGVDSELLAAQGAVDPQVAGQMARGVRTALAVDGVPADVGISTTGVAGPDPQDGHSPGTVFISVALGDDVQTLRLSLEGNREHIRAAVVSESLVQLQQRLQTEPEYLPVQLPLRE